ncbi:MAG: hypothetical protein IH591_05040, partial [Bacteroidales bacterium]|nr:hypothetical protein [Bacteroidales bacterium]
INTDIDSVIVCGTATIDHSDPETAANSMKLIIMDVKSEGDTISVNTIFDEKFFSSAYKTGRKGFNINYVIKAPGYVNINLDNSFGDIVLDKITGSTTIKLAHGNLIVGELTRGNQKPINSIVIRDAGASINKANWLSLETVNCQSVEISSVQALSAISESSTISIEKVNSVVLNSKYDIYAIGMVTNCSAETWLSKIKISGLADMLEINAKVSTVRIDEIEEGFRNIVITGDNSGFSLAFKPSVSFLLNAGLKNSAADISGVKFHNLVREGGKNADFNLRGFVGIDHNTGSRIEAGISNGKLELLNLSLRFSDSR